MLPVSTISHIEADIALAEQPHGKQPLDAETLVARAREIAPRLAERAQATELNRAPLDESIRELVDAGLMAILTPTRFGGHGLHLDTMSRVVSILAAACPSTAWVASFYIGQAWRAALLPMEGQEELFRSRNYALGAGQAAPVAKVEIVPGGYRITGRTAWSSGIVHADWVIFGGLVYPPDGPPEARTFTIPRDQVEMIDTWHVTGMKGTGSHDVAVHDVFVPAHRSLSLADLLAGMAPGAAIHADQPLYALPLMPALFVEPLPVFVGALRGATDIFLSQVRARHNTNTGEAVSAKASARMRLGRVLAQTRLAEQMLDAYVADLLTPGAPDRLRPLEARAAAKMNAVLIIELAADTMRLIMQGVGANGYREANPLQRYARDLEILRLHAFLDPDTASESLGTLAFGATPNDPLL